MLPTKFESIVLSVQEKKQYIDFQDGHHSGDLGFPIGKILAIFNLQITPKRPSQVEVNWPFGSGKEVKKRPSWISNKNNFTFFYVFFIYKLPQCFLPSFESVGLLVQEKK